MTQQRTPGPDHPITIAPVDGTVVVRAGGAEIARTTNALRLKEATYPAVLYVPREDADMAMLEPTEHHTHCPYKGDASYFSIPAVGNAGVNAVWSYPAPYDAVAPIAGHLAFYADRVQVEVSGDADESPN